MIFPSHYQELHTIQIPRQQPYDELMGLMNASDITAESNLWRTKQPAKRSPTLFVAMVKVNLILCAEPDNKL
jgi:hypothetical protein